MKSFLVYLLVILSFQSFSQTQIIPIMVGSNARYGIPYRKHNGYIELNNGKKVDGTFQYALFEFPNYNLKVLASNGKVITRYRSKEIKRVALSGSDTTLFHDDSTYFYVFKGSPYFLRQLAGDSTIEIFDWLFNVNERPGLIYPYLIVRKDNEFHEFKTSKLFIEWMQKNDSDKIKWFNNITVKDVIRQLNGLSS